MRKSCLKAIRKKSEESPLNRSDISQPISTVCYLLRKSLMRRLHLISANQRNRNIPSRKCLRFCRAILLNCRILVMLFWWPGTRLKMREMDISWRTWILPNLPALSEALWPSSSDKWRFLTGNNLKNSDKELGLYSSNSGNWSSRPSTWRSTSESSKEAS